MEYIELLEVLFVEMDPLEEGFSGALVEVHRQGDRYVLLETAPATGNRLLRFSSKDKELVYAAFARKRGRPLQYSRARIRSAATPFLYNGGKNPCTILFQNGALCSLPLRAMARSPACQSAKALPLSLLLAFYALVAECT